MFGKILRQLRKQKGVTQAELAAVLNLDASSISKYEKADVSPSADILLKIARYFDVPTDYLLGLPDTKKAPSREDADLSSDEAALLMDFRKLTEDQKAFVLQAVKAEAIRKADEQKK